MEKPVDEEAEVGGYGVRGINLFCDWFIGDGGDGNLGKKGVGASVSVMPLSTYLNLRLGELAHTKLTVELADMNVKYPKGISKNVLVEPLILERPFLSTAHAKIGVFKRKITLRIKEEVIIFKSVKPASSLIKRVYILSLREIMELDLEARLMGETLVINRSLDPLNGDYIELNGLNEPFDLRRNQGDDLMPTIEEGEVIEEFRTRNDELDTGINDCPSCCDYDKKIHIDYFVFLEDMDAYRNDGMGDVSDKDKKNGISQSYQKLKGFYKGDLNLGPDYIRDAKTEEWLTRGHISVHEME
ncbi:hypothetical protein Tco_0975122 [Tanacetum coccineum]|uniref:Uncharacterized protein n=1 Tax=Tanacetum coccineum TaxID=301880 RepID=A0ABQ5EDG6_9ASTR